MKTFKLVLLLALVFLSGAVAGVVGTRAVVRRVVQQAVLHPERVQSVIERSLTRKLKLDAGQQVKLRGILSGAHGQLKDLRREYGPQYGLIVSNVSGQITAMLSPEQQVRFQELKLKNRVLLSVLQENRAP
jgi:hypothetical protein